MKGSQSPPGPHCASVLHGYPQLHRQVPLRLAVKVGRWSAGTVLLSVRAGCREVCILLDPARGWSVAAGLATATATRKTHATNIAHDIILAYALRFCIFRFYHSLFRL